MEALNLLELQFFFGVLPPGRVVRGAVFDQVPEDAGEVDSLAVARPARRAGSLRSHSFRGSSAQVCAMAVIALGLPSRARQRWDQGGIGAGRAGLGGVDRSSWWLLFVSWLSGA